MTGAATPYDQPAVGGLGEPDVQGVALHERVRRDVAELAAPREQPLGPQHEAGGEVGAATHPATVPALHPGGVVDAQGTGDLLAAEKRRVADDGVEALVVGVGEDLRKHHRPMQRPARDGARRPALLQVLGRPLAQRLAVDRRPAVPRDREVRELRVGSPGPQGRGAQPDGGDRVGCRGSLLRLVPRLGEQPGLELHVPSADDGLRGDPAAQVGSAPELLGEQLAVEGPRPAVGVGVHGLQLLQRRQAEQAVASDEPVVEEAERPLAVHRHQPERELRHLDRERVDVDAVQAVLGDESTSVESDPLHLGVAGRPGRRRTGAQHLAAALGLPGFEQPVGEVATGRDQEGPRPHRDVGDPQREDVEGGPDPPGRPVGGLERPGPVNQRLQGVDDHVLGERARRVMGARARPASPRCDEAPAGQGDGGQPTGIGVQHPGVRLDLVGEHRITAAGLYEGGTPQPVALGLERPGDPRPAPAGAVADPLGERRVARRAQPRKGLRERDLRRRPRLGPPRRPGEAEHYRVGGAYLQLEQTLVDVADLLDVQGAERQPAALATEVHLLYGLEHPQHGAVVDRGRRPAAALQPGVAAGVEQSAAVRR